MRYPNKSNPKPEEAESDPQGSKMVHASWNPPSFPWGNWLPVTSAKPIIQIIGSHIQSNERRHHFTIYTNLTRTSQQTKGKTVSLVPQLCLQLYLQYLRFAYEIWPNQTKPNTKVYPKRDIKFTPCTLKNYKFKLWKTLFTKLKHKPQKNIFTKYTFDKGLYSNYIKKSGANNLMKKCINLNAWPKKRYR